MFDIEVVFSAVNRLFSNNQEGFMKRILVTGGAGFIGSHLCERLLTDGHSVFCLDNFFTGTKKNIKHLLSNNNFKLLHHDVINPVHEEVDIIYNLACPASPFYYQIDPVYTIKTNVYGIMNMLNLAKKVDAKLFQASTSEVYGDPTIHPQTEDYCGNVNIIGPRSCYDEGKRLAETICFDYQRQYGIYIKIARIFNTYGEQMQLKDGRVVSNFIVQALQNQPITLYGDGTQTRSFCYVKDIIEGFIRLTNSNNDITGPINLGNPEEISMVELAKIVINLTNSRSPLIFMPLPKDDPKRRCPDISLARQKLDWQPCTNLQNGLKYTIVYFEKLLQNTNHNSLLP